MNQGLEGIRRHRRYRLDIDNRAGGQRLKDMSLGGMRVQSTRALSLDETIEISLSGPAGPMVLRGTVVRARCTGLDDLPYEYGLIFAEVTEETAARMKAFLDARGREEEAFTAIEPGELESLRDRISELESELISARERAARLAEHGVVGGASPAAVPTTRFERDRFARLVEAGQPLMLLVERPDTYLSGRLNQALAGAMTSTFDLERLTRKLDQTSPAALVSALFAFYERDLIDFA